MAKETYSVFFHFDNDNTTRLNTTNPSEILDSVSKQEKGWLKVDEKLINLDNVTFITYQKNKKS